MTLLHALTTTVTTAAEPGPQVPRIPVGQVLADGFDWINTNLEGFFDVVKVVVDVAVTGLTDLLLAPWPVVTIALLAALALVTAGWRVGLVALVGLLLIDGMEQWDFAMETLALVLVASLVAVLLAVPIGVLAARSSTVSAIVRPVLDFMQTMPAFVWLVPVVTLFSIGPVPGVVATIIFALPPGVRLTELGIRQVDHELVEAGQAFGSTPSQILRGIQLPLAMPTIMAGINQVIMLALSMAVIAGLVGAGGLGGQVTSAIATLNLALGFEAGLSVVILAVYLDRITSALGRRDPGRPGRSWRRFSRRSGDPAGTGDHAGSAGSTDAGDGAGEDTPDVVDPVDARARMRT